MAHQRNSRNIFLNQCHPPSSPPLPPPLVRDFSREIAKSISVNGKFHSTFARARARARLCVRPFFLLFFFSFLFYFENEIDRGWCGRIVRLDRCHEKLIKISPSRHEFRAHVRQKPVCLRALSCRPPTGLVERSWKNRARGESRPLTDGSRSPHHFLFSFFIYTYICIYPINPERTTNRIDRHLKMKLEIERLPVIENEKTAGRWGRGGEESAATSHRINWISVARGFAISFSQIKRINIALPGLTKKKKKKKKSSRNDT